MRELQISLFLAIIVFLAYWINESKEPRKIAKEPIPNVSSAAPEKAPEKVPKGIVWAEVEENGVKRWDIVSPKISPVTQDFTFENGRYFKQGGHWYREDLSAKINKQPVQWAVSPKGHYYLPVLDLTSDGRIYRQPNGLLYKVEEDSKKVFVWIVDEESADVSNTWRARPKGQFSVTRNLVSSDFDNWQEQNRFILKVYQVFSTNNQAMDLFEQEMKTQGVQILGLDPIKRPMALAITATAFDCYPMNLLRNFVENLKFSSSMYSSALGAEAAGMAISNYKLIMINQTFIPAVATENSSEIAERHSTFHHEIGHMITIPTMNWVEFSSCNPQGFRYVGYSNRAADHHRDLAEGYGGTNEFEDAACITEKLIMDPYSVGEVTQYWNWQASEKVKRSDAFCRKYALIADVYNKHMGFKFDPQFARKYFLYDIKSTRTYVPLEKLVPNANLFMPLGTQLSPEVKRDF